MLLICTSRLWKRWPLMRAWINACSLSSKVDGMLWNECISLHHARTNFIAVKQWLSWLPDCRERKSMSLLPSCWVCLFICCNAYRRVHASIEWGCERDRGPAAVAALYLLPRHCALHRICMNNRLPPCGPPIYNRYTVDECNIEDADYLILSKAVQCEREGEEEMSWDYIIWLLLNKNDGKWFDRVMVYHASPGVFI